MPISNQKEEIDSRILRLIGLDDVFDLDYETYLTLLKEAMVKGRMAKTTIPTEEVELLTNEYKRVKSKKDQGRFEVKKKKISGKSFTIGSVKGKILGTATKSLPGTAISASPLSKSLESNISAITSAVVSISETLRQQKKISDDTSAYDRRKAEQEKRGLAESKLEKRFEGLKKIAEKIIAPVKSLLDRVIEFFTNIILGRIVYKLVEWLGDPKNESKVKSIIRFVKDWWPALIGSYILFGTSFGRLTLGLTKMIGGFIFRIGKVAIPSLLRFVARNPRAAAAIGLFTAGATIPAMFPGTVDEQERQTKSKPGSTEDKIRALEQQKANLNIFQRMQGVGSEIDEQISALKTGQTKSYGFNGGGFSGGLASGYVSGEKGVDKVPAMLSDGEFVMSTGAVAKYGVDTLEAMNAAGGGTNQPKIMGGKIYAAGGGLIDNVKQFIKYKLGYDVDKPETWGTSFSGGISGLSRGSVPNMNFGRVGGGIFEELRGLANRAQGVVRSGLDPRSYQGLANRAQGVVRSGLDPRSYQGLANRAQDLVKLPQGLFGVLDSPLASLEKYGTERENALIKSGELKPDAALTKTTQSNLEKSDAWIKSLYDPKKDKGFVGSVKERFQDIQNKGLFADPLAILGLKEEGTEKFVERISGGRVKNFGAKITGLQYALKGLAGPLGKAFRIDDRGSLGRYVRPAMLEAQRRGQGGVGAVGLGQADYNRLMGDKLANLALGQFNFRVGKNGRAITNDTYEGNRPASDYFKGARSDLRKGDIGGALFKGLSGVLRINQNTGWGNLRPGGAGIDLGGGFTPTDDKGKPIPPTKPKSSVTLYGPNDPRRNQSGPYQSRFARPRNAGVRPVNPPPASRPRVVYGPPVPVTSTKPRNNTSSSRPPNFSATTAGSNHKTRILGVHGHSQASYR
jgi:hypothetical protein